MEESENAEGLEEQRRNICHCMQKRQHFEEQCLMGSSKLHANNYSHHLLARELGVWKKIKQW